MSAAGPCEKAAVRALEAQTSDSYLIHLAIARALDAELAKLTDRVSAIEQESDR